MSPELLYYFAPALAVFLSSTGTALGEGNASIGALTTFDRQPLGTQQTMRTLIIGLALIESGGILSLVMALVLLFSSAGTFVWGVGWAQLGMGIALGLAGFIVGLASSFAVRGACTSISRQPFFAPKIITLMLVSQSIIEAPVIFAFVVALLINSKITPDLSTVEGLKLLAAGCVIGVGSIGPSLGQAFFSHASCTAVGVNRKAFQKVFAFSMLSQAIIETPVMFCLLLSMLLIFRPFVIMEPVYALVAVFSASFALSVGSIGTGIASGYVASWSCYQIIQLTNQYTGVFRATVLAQVFIESSAIYALIIALFLVLRVT